MIYISPYIHISHIHPQLLILALKKPTAGNDATNIYFALI